MPDPRPTEIMTQLLGGFQVSQAVYVLAKLDLPTMLDEAGGPLPVEQLAERSGAQVKPLRRLLRTLAALGVVSLDGEAVSLTPLGATLSRHAPDSVRAVSLMWTETHYLPFSELLHTVTTGEPGATHYLGRPFFDWMAEDAGRSELFSEAMAAVTAGWRTGMFDAYDLPEGKVVADVGGANGSVLVELIGNRPDRRGIVLDLPPVTPTARANVAAHGLADRVDVVEGDFFDSVPAADVYVLSYIMHDWDDDAAAQILRTIAKAGTRGARVLVVEAVVPDGDEPHLAKMIDLTMLGMLSGQERSAAEYETLFRSAGLTLDRIVPTPSPFSVLEATVT